MHLVAPVMERLGARVTDLAGRVAGAADLSRLQAQGAFPTATPYAHVLPAGINARGDNDMQAFDRRIPNDVLRLAVSVVLWGATIVATSTVALLQITKAPLDYVLFDAISAFATSGLTTGLTESLPDEGKYILAATMWAGRVGTVTLAAALAASQRAQLFRRAEERPLVG